MNERLWMAEAPRLSGAPRRSLARSSSRASAGCEPRAAGCRRSGSVLWLAGVLGLWLAACSQSQGEPCQVDRDCDDGLVCQGGGERSTCEEPQAGGGEADAATRQDAAPAEDAAADGTDAAADQADAAADEADAAADEDAGE